MNRTLIYHISFILLVGLVVFFTMPTQGRLSAGDCGDYVYAAHGIAQGNKPDISSNYANRIGTYWVAAAIYAMGFTNNALGYGTTIQFLFTLLLVYATLWRYNRNAAFIAASLIGVTRIMVQYSTQVMGDIPIALWANAPVLLYFYFKTQGKRNAILTGLGIGILFIAALLTKESIAFYVPLILILVWFDFRYWKKHSQVPFMANSETRLWLSAGISVSAGVILIGLYYYANTSDFLYRIHLTNSQPTVSDCNYLHAPLLLIIKRITYQPFQFLIENFGFGVLILFALLNIVSPAKNWYERFFKIYLLATLGMWWVGPQGLPWNPVALVHRIWLPLIIPLGINAALFLNTIVTGEVLKKQQILYGLIITAFTVLAWVSLTVSENAYLQLHIADKQSFSVLKKAYLATCLIALLAVCTKIRITISAGKSDSLLPPFISGGKAYLFWTILIIHGYGLLQEAVCWAQNDNLTDHYKATCQLVSIAENSGTPLILTERNIVDKYHIYDNFKGEYPFKNWIDVSIESIPNGAMLLIDEYSVGDRLRQVNETNIYTSYNPSTYDQIPDYVINPDGYRFALINKTEGVQLWQKR